MSKTRPEIIRYLKSGIPLFAGFSEELLDKLVNSSRVVSFEPNEAIVHYGAEATHFGVILSGTVTASVIGEGGARLDLGRLEAGSTFGELALMTGEKTLAELIAATRCEVLLIPVSVFQ
ncbi:MAG: cyclic nucleotide-binding domain-containing protein, partial [Candidatus Brocadia sp.]